MSNAKTFKAGGVRLASFAIVAALHITLLLIVVFNVKVDTAKEEPIAGVMKLVDIQEYIPPPPPPPEKPPPEITQGITQDAIAENVIETDDPPPPAVHEYQPVIPVPEQQIEYLPQHRISVLPVLPDDQIRRATIYPPIAQRSGVEGTVYLDLFIDSQGFVRNVIILRETPVGRGFGEAAVNAFKGIHGKPAEANGVPVAARYRYNISFKLN